MSSCIATIKLGTVLLCDYKEERTNVLLTAPSSHIRIGYNLFLESIINLSMISGCHSNWAATFRRSLHPILTTNTFFALRALKLVSI